ncbi:asparagine synthase (glutamine-hydrolyzing) [Candidatus Thiosymbion oneisti]|uniref:asparagine synthase (glutamine-hydrolyzing) n=1 Tax=Candidatus Thiosymbion oneisti TaxID=589554 RepID=UPI000B1DBA9E|nr:asparagine synthase (glutamine-hydrolyzing) [Candidatus Thiosymbion oneisti]
MCGVAGVFFRTATSVDTTVRIAGHMASALVHRGPDDGGQWIDRDVGIALIHRRLSILDLSPTGHQPMVSASGRFVLVFNGEIYNHLELRKELEREGVQAPLSGPLPEEEGVYAPWRGHSDTETLLAACERWGLEETLRRAVGMFAIALWDRAERQLHLARDRLGEKPLYYGWCRGGFVFASELKALRRFPGFDNPVDRNALAAYLRFLYVPEPWSIYQGIYKLEPGCRLTLTGEGVTNLPSAPPHAPMDARGLLLRRWWSLHRVTEAGNAAPLGDEVAAVSALEERLRESIRLQSVADVPLGAFLSGGVDSSTIVALMQSEAVAPVRTFTIGFEDAAYDEAIYARAIAHHLGTDHTELSVTPHETLDVIPQLPRIYDEPFADSSQIPTLLVCRQARRHVTVALSGDAGDELFGGYNRYLWVQRIWTKLAWMPWPVRQAAVRLILSRSVDRWDTLGAWLKIRVNLLGDKAHKLAEGLSGVHDLDDLYHNLVSEWKQPMTVVLGAREVSTLLAHRDEWPVLREPEHRMMYLDAMTYLPGDILCKVDRAAMAVSLETRAPFLDHRVVELAWRMPLAMKICGGVGKWPLRRILYKYVPRELIERPKQGFGIPLAEWLRGPLRDWAEDLLDERRLNDEGFLNPVPIRRYWREHLGRRRNRQHALWAVLMFQAWLEART